MPILSGERQTRGRPIPYRFLESKAAMFGSPTLAMTGDRFKLLTNLSIDGGEDLLFDLQDDPAERTDVLAANKAVAREYREALASFIQSCRKSHSGADYDGPYRPTEEFQEVTGAWK
jgi:hypothetical protein